MNRLDLTKGKIKSNIIKLSIPIVATSFIQTAYNLIDMLWIGKLGSDALAAVATAGFYLWLSAAVIILARTGTEIFVSQSTGQGDEKRAKSFAQNGLFIALILAIIFSSSLFIFRTPLIALFNIEDEYVNSLSRSYLAIVSIGIFFDFFVQVFTGIFIGRGNSKLPFAVNAVGLVCNLVLDPLFIFGLGSFAGFGFNGAAIATTLSKIIIFLLYIYFIKYKHYLFHKLQILVKPDFSIIKKILKLGIFPSIYNACFCIFSILLTIVISSFGTDAIAASRVGSQIEALSWNTAGGFSVAIGTYTGQNYGAKLYDRVIAGYVETMKITLLLGLVTTLFLYFFAYPLSAIFFPKDMAPLLICVDYLKILALSQIFMCIEITTTGVFNGIGKTMPPSIVSIILNGSRIPLAIFLSSTSLGISGIWYAVTITSVLKGIVMTVWFLLFVHKDKNLSFKNVHLIHNN